MKQNRAFSLVELSIVILVIGIVIAGVTQTSRLIGQMKLSSARTLSQSSDVNGIKDLILIFLAKFFHRFWQIESPAAGRPPAAGRGL